MLNVIILLISLTAYFRQVQVNGQVLKLVDEKTLPKIEPKRLAPGESIVVPANSFGFYVIPNAKAQACGHVSNQL